MLDRQAGSELVIKSRQWPNVQQMRSKKKEKKANLYFGKVFFSEHIESF